MFEDISAIAENCAYLRATTESAPNIELYNNLPNYEDLISLEDSLKKQNLIIFDKIFKEPNGYYLLKCFLIADYNVDKAVFVHDVDIFKTMRDPLALLRVAQELYDRFLTPEDVSNYNKGVSVFDSQYKVEMERRKTKNGIAIPIISPRKEKTVFNSGNTNAVGVFGTIISEVKTLLDQKMAPPTMFNAVGEAVLEDLRLDIFPRFLKSEFYKKYIRTKYYETLSTSPKDFTMLRVLGRGAFGSVNAARKNSCGKLYAIKCMSKRQVKMQDSLENVMQERDLMSLIDSPFVVCLKYAYQDRDNLYLVLDLMSGGDLKYHLNNERSFAEPRLAFYAAEILLGLEALHRQNIIYRDMKPENILLDGDGHCKISDLGLAVQSKHKQKGYAGTPGYTAPEICAHKAYGPSCDFFSFGVTIYRLITGRKPYQGEKGSDLDDNVLNIEPEYPPEDFSPAAISIMKGLLIKDVTKRLGCRPKGIQEIKDHPFFANIDWGLLEAGYLKAPFIPNKEEIYAESSMDIGQIDDKKWAHVKLTDDFQSQLETFDFKSLTAVRKEIVEVLVKIDDGVNFEKFSLQKPKPVEIKKVEVDSCCNIM